MYGPSTIMCNFLRRDQQCIDMVGGGLASLSAAVAMQVLQGWQDPPLGWMVTQPTCLHSKRDTFFHVHGMHIVQSYAESSVRHVHDEGCRQLQVWQQAFNVPFYLSG